MRGGGVNVWVEINAGVVAATVGSDDAQAFRLIIASRERNPKSIFFIIHPGKQV
jgi:hypothetical protein